MMRGGSREGPLEALLRFPGGFLGASWGPLRGLWGPLWGASSGPLGGLLGPLAASWGSLGGL
eukprot:1682708-Pyramimonas_sp.AAC.1